MAYISTGMAAPYDAPGDLRIRAAIGLDAQEALRDAAMAGQGRPGSDRKSPPLWHASVPIRFRDGTGCLRVLDPEPRKLSPDQLQTLEALGGQAAALLELGDMRSPGKAGRDDPERKEVGVDFDDITQQRLTQESLRQSLERFELIARATNDGLWEWNLSTGQMWWNQRSYQLFGYDPATFTPSPETASARIHPEDWERVVTAFTDIREGRTSQGTEEYRFQRSDGSVGHIYDRVYAVPGPDGKPARLVGAMADITELRRTDEALLESEERYRRLVELSPDVIAIVVDGRVDFINQAGLSFYGAESLSEIQGRSLLDFFHPDSRGQVISRQILIDSGLPAPPLELKFLRKDGSTIEAESRATPFLYRGKHATLAVIRDVTERKQAEAATRSSEERYRLLFQRNPQPVWVFDSETLRFLDVNDAALRQYGYSREEFLSMTIMDIRPPDEVIPLEPAIKEVPEIEEFKGVWRHRKKDGSIIRVEVIRHLIQFFGRKAAIVLAVDITEKLQAQEKLRLSEERYRTLARVSPVGLFRTDSRGRCTYINEQACLLTGLTPEQAEGMGWIDALHPEDAERVTREWEITAASGQPFHSEYRFRRPDGFTTWVLGKALADRGPDRSIMGFVGTVTDITERKQAETLLAGQKRTLAMVASGWPRKEVLDSLVLYMEKESAGAMGAILLLDPDAGYLGWASARSLPEEYRNAVKSFPIGPQGGACGVSAARKEIVITPDISADSSWLDHAGSALRSGLRACAAVPIIGSHGQVLGIFAFFYGQPGEPKPYDIKLMETASDLAGITIERWKQEQVSRKNQELSELNRRILEANRMKSEFLASMSHELRTPLNAIIGFSQFLIDLKVGPLNEKQSEYLGDILDGGMHLLRVINDILDLAKIEAGKMKIFPEPLPVAGTIREVCDILHPMAVNKGVSLRIVADLKPETASLDAQKFRQILYNLISNAIKFSRQGGEVCVTAERDYAGILRLKVADQGIGIRKEDLTKLFQEFQQLDSGSARHYPGTGLGLVITKRLVELHRGTVGVESEPGRGSVFHAAFPKIDERES